MANKYAYGKKFGCILILSLGFITLLLSACQVTEIDNKKLIGKEEINTYASIKTEADYCSEEWIKLQEIVSAANDKIESALTEQEINYIVCETKIAIDGIIPQKVDQISDGYYYLSDDSWEMYVREFANRNEKDETWIQETIDNYGEDSSEKSFLPRSYYFSVVLDNQITIFQERNFSYLLLQCNNGSYAGKIAQREIELYVLGNDLYVQQSTGWTLHFQRDSSYNTLDGTITEKELESPREISYFTDTDRLVLKWDYYSEYGSMGAVGEIKRAGDEYFEVNQYELVYMNMYVMEFKLSEFVKGDNFVRIYHKGGPLVTKEKDFVLFTDSDYITFVVRVSDEITVEKI